jgi:hypothetical protein
VAEDAHSREICGIIAVSPEWSDWWASEYWWVISVFVSADSRRRGMASALFTAMLAAAADEKVQTVNLRCECENGSARRFYESIGFVVDDSHLVMSKGNKPDGSQVGTDPTAAEREKVNLDSDSHTQPASASGQGQEFMAGLAVGAAIGAIFAGLLMRQSR